MVPGGAALRSVNSLFFAAVIAGVFVVATVTRRERTAGALIFGVLAAAIIGFSPFALELLVSPLGGALACTVALCAAAAADVAGLWTLPLWARCALAAALTLANPLLVLAALVYGALAPNGARARAGVVGIAAAAFAVRCALARPSLNALLHLPFDSMAGPLSVIVVSVTLFFIVPALLYARVRPERALLFGFAAAIAGMFASAGDPSVYVLVLEAAIVAVLLVSARDSTASRRWVVTFAAIAAVQAAVLLQVHQTMPSVTIAGETALLHQTIAVDKTYGDRTCIVADAAAKQHVLARAAGAFSPLEAPTVDACGGDPISTRVITMNDLDLQDWGVSALNLIRAATAAQQPSAFVFPYADGDIFPKTRVPSPTDEGVFAQRQPVPGWRVPSFTVHSGFSYRFACISAPGGRRLTFAVSQNSRGPATYDVSMRTGRRTFQIASGSLPHVRIGDAAWRYVTAKLPAPANCAAFVFSVPLPNTGAVRWVTFAGAALGQ